jgi:hypothetical protein
MVVDITAQVDQVSVKHGLREIETYCYLHVLIFHFLILQLKSCQIMGLTFVINGMKHLTYFFAVTVVQFVRRRKP